VCGLVTLIGCFVELGDFIYTHTPNGCGFQILHKVPGLIERAPGTYVAMLLDPEQPVEDWWQLGVSRYTRRQFHTPLGLDVELHFVSNGISTRCGALETVS